MTPLDRRLTRRLTHRSRSASVAVALVLVALGALYVATEIALELLGRPALLVTPGDALATTSAGSPWVLAVAAGAALFGVVAIVLAVTPGRRARHALADDRMTVVADDAVLAGTLRRSVAETVGVRRDRVRATLGRRRADFGVTPPSGLTIDRAAADARATEVLAALRPRPAVRPRVTVATRGVVGA